jgi:tetratricopeptide (TPR) repeat protein
VEPTVSQEIPAAAAAEALPAVEEIPPAIEQVEAEGMEEPEAAEQIELPQAEQPFPSEEIPAREAIVEPAALGDEAIPQAVEISQPEMEAEAAEPVKEPEMEAESGEPVEEPAISQRVILIQARDALAQGQPSQAAQLFSGLIKQDYHLEEIVKDLQDALYSFPLDIEMWISLGDALNRTSDLQQALDAYTKAEELVR